MRDPVLKNKIIKTNQAVWEEFANSPKNGAARLKLFYLIIGLKKFHFKDLCIRPQSM